MSRLGVQGMRSEAAFRNRTEEQTCILECKRLIGCNSVSEVVAESSKDFVFNTRNRLALEP